MTRVVINADDYGLTDGITRAIDELIQLDAISCTTAMVCADNAEIHLRGSKNFFGGRIGLHLQLTGGRPISDAKDVPSLVDKYSQRFLPKREFSYANPTEVELEWTNQVYRFLEIFNRLPSHLDSHHGPHRHPELALVYFQVARHFRLPVRGFDKAYWSLAKRKMVESTPVVTNLWTTKSRNNFDFVKELRAASRTVPVDLVEVVTHPGHIDPSLSKCSSLIEPRAHEFKILKIMAESNYLSKQGVKILPCFTAL